MSTLYDESHELFRQSFRSFADAEVVPRIEEFERAGIMDRAVYAEAGKHGFVGMNIPEQWGGGGTTDFRYNAVIG